MCCQSRVDDHVLYCLWKVHPVPNICGSATFMWALFALYVRFSIFCPMKQVLLNEKDLGPIHGLSQPIFGPIFKASLFPFHLTLNERSTKEIYSMFRIFLKLFLSSKRNGCLTHAEPGVLHDLYEFLDTCTSFQRHRYFVCQSFHVFENYYLQNSCN